MSAVFIPGSSEDIIADNHASVAYCFYRFYRLIRFIHHTPHDCPPFCSRLRTSESLQQNKLYHSTSESQDNLHITPGTMPYIGDQNNRRVLFLASRLYIR